MILSLFLMMLLILSIGCESSQPPVVETLPPPPVINGTASMLISLTPRLPEPPMFPKSLNWGYDSGKCLYTLDEAGVNAILEFRDNLYGSKETRGYLYDIETYKKQVSVIHSRIRELGL